MSETHQKIKELDGKQLYHSFLAGAQRIFEQQKLLNKINAVDPKLWDELGIPRP